MKLKNRKDYRVRRHMRLRQKIAGTAQRPRMAIFISNAHMYVQFVDDDAHRTLAFVSTLKMGANVNCETAAKLGAAAAEAALAKDIRKVVVDRGGFQYHGRVKAIVDAAVQAGLSITTADKPATADKENSK
jgi:large subunit ribosomal protein L18